LGWACARFMLDGDNLRHGLNGDLSFSATDRTENIRRAAEVAKLAFDHGSLVLCSFISPFRADRDVARSLLPGGAFLEIYVACDVEVCKRRDPKGLYARALAGEVADFTGVSSPYEEPLQPDLLLDSSVLSPEQSVARILEELRNRGIIS
jgi:adenylyl-sulfate kinase